MRTERYNIYDKVHRDLRKQLLDAGLKIQLTDFSKPEQTKKTFAIIKNVIACFEKYMEEDIMIYHAIAQTAPYIVVIMEKVNEKNQQVTASITEKIDQYTLLRTGRIRRDAGLDIQGLFFEFTASVLQNMNKEQTVINELLWAKYSDSELMIMEDEVMTRILPGDARFYSKEDLASIADSMTLKLKPLLFQFASPFVGKKLARTAVNMIPARNWSIVRKYYGIA